MDILEIAIKAAGGVGRLAYLLDVKQNVVSNWKVRGVPKGWAKVIEMMFKKEILKTKRKESND